MKKYSQGGFTLIELLVVIAIIGILSSVVLASLSTARNKARDAAIRSELSSLRDAAEIYYSNALTYGTIGTSCTAANSVFADTDVARIITKIEADNGTGTMVCGNSPTAWAAQTPLVGDAVNRVCVDSSGRVYSGTQQILAGATNCP